METNNTQSANVEQEEISIVEILFHYLRHWKSFLLSIIICLGLASAYLIYSVPRYKVVSRIIINDDKKGQSMDVGTAFSDLGIFDNKSNLDNEIEIFRSRTLMRGVVDSLRIGVSYFKRETIQSREIYNETPVFVSIPNPIMSGVFTVDLVEGNSLSIHSDTENFNQTVEAGKEINTPWGVLAFTFNPFGTMSYPIDILVKNPKGSSFLPKVDITPVSKTSSVVELSIITPSPQKGQDIINTLVLHYNQNTIDDKNYVAKSTITFIDERLRSVSGELKTAEKNIEDYQKSKGITNLQTQGQILLTATSEYNKKTTDAEIQLDLLRNIKSHIMNPANKGNGVPSNVGLTGNTITNLINNYNTAIIEKKRATDGMLGNHPMLIEYDNRIALLRENLLNGISIEESSIQSTLRGLKKQENQNLGQALNLSTQERESRDLSRQQTLKETLYTYLLQKREETGLTLAMATPNAKVIDSAFYDPRPVAPKKKVILLAALMMAIIIPVIIIYIRNLFDYKIHTKEDVTRVISAPFLGIVPELKEKDPFPVLKVRSSTAERFRTIISNLGFVISGEERKIITVTSYTSGDGKSFFSRNLAMTLASTGKKTLLIDLDLRKSVLSKTLQLKSTKKGSAMFLSDSTVTLNEIIDKSGQYHKNLDIIPVKVFPPNPAELLSSERLDQLFQDIMQKDYDYIIVDTAPAGLVADIYNINSYSTATIFLLRSDSTYKNTLPEIQELYKNKKMNNLSVVLNAVSKENHGYGYGYGNDKHNYYTDES